MEENTEYTLNYRWGFTLDDDDEPDGWFISVNALDTPWYAMAYYSLDDSEQNRHYRTNNDELLTVLMEENEARLYSRCIEEKNMILQSQAEIEQMTVANFM